MNAIKGDLKKFWTYVYKFLFKVFAHDFAKDLVGIARMDFAGVVTEMKRSRVGGIVCLRNTDILTQKASHIKSIHS